MTHRDEENRQKRSAPASELGIEGLKGEELRALCGSLNQLAEEKGTPPEHCLNEGAHRKRKEGASDLICKLRTSRKRGLIAKGEKRKRFKRRTARAGGEV